MSHSNTPEEKISEAMDEQLGVSPLTERFPAPWHKLPSLPVPFRQVYSFPTPVDKPPSPAPSGRGREPFRSPKPVVTVRVPAGTSVQVVDEEMAARSLGEMNERLKEMEQRLEAAETSFNNVYSKMRRLLFCCVRMNGQIVALEASRRNLEIQKLNATAVLEDKHAVLRPLYSARSGGVIPGFPKFLGDLNDLTIPCANAIGPPLEAGCVFILQDLDLSIDGNLTQLQRRIREVTM
ncbi:hypothetical protein B0T10DRAFT_459983 [Thelonectria olida]|uniref:Uncharacterized protein n=1 Tax=Thelonectria olida TaxID=1576542 RepID=A0A9P8W4T7_9HYPO|nr:hypothetical protein B0T10DRAFT_459983 [Thelonectria olida]